jgi:hypothetical protein
MERGTRLLAMFVWIPKPTPSREDDIMREETCEKRPVANKKRS